MVVEGRYKLVNNEIYQENLLCRRLRKFYHATAENNHFRLLASALMYFDVVYIQRFTFKELEGERLFELVELPPKRRDAPELNI